MRQVLLSMQRGLPPATFTHVQVSPTTLSPLCLFTLELLYFLLFLTLKIDLSTGNFTQYSVMTYMGIESEKRVAIGITDSLCYIEETNNIVS